MYMRDRSKPHIRRLCRRKHVQIVNLGHVRDNSACAVVTFTELPSGMYNNIKLVATILSTKREWSEYLNSVVILITISTRGDTEWTTKLSLFTTRHPKLGDNLT